MWLIRGCAAGQGMVFGLFVLNSIPFAAVPFTLANKRWRYATALCELDVKKGWGKGGGKAKSAGANGGERERKRHATAADIRRILTRTGPK